MSCSFWDRELISNSLFYDLFCVVYLSCLYVGKAIGYEPSNNSTIREFVFVVFQLSINVVYDYSRE